MSPNQRPILFVSLPESGLPNLTLVPVAHLRRQSAADLLLGVAALATDQARH